MLDMSVTLDVSNPVRSRILREVHPLNMFDMFVTLAVLKPILIFSRELHPLNMLDISVTSLVFRF